MSLQNELLEAIKEIPVIDIHSHLPRGGMTAQNPAQVIFYHMLSYPLRAAGVPHDQLWPNQDVMHSEVCPHEYWETARSVNKTAFGWAMRKILKDLYGFEDEITSETFPQLQERITRESQDIDRAKRIIGENNIESILSSRVTWSEHKGISPDYDDYDPIIDTNEFGGNAGSEGTTNRHLKKYMKEKHGIDKITAETMRDFITKMNTDPRRKWNERKVLVQWINGFTDITPVSDSVIDDLLVRQENEEKLTVEESGLIDGFILTCTMEALRDTIKVYQFCYGTQFMSRGRSHGVQRAAPNFASSLGELFKKFPEIHFNVLNGFENDEPTWCSHTQAYENVSLGGYWWNCFYPSVMHQAWQRRFDMVPTKRLMGFFSDGYCVEWIYGRLVTTRQVLANVFAERINQGFCTKAEALETAREILYETPKDIML